MFQRKKERKKRHFTFGLSSLIEPICIYQILHVDLNPSEILETTPVKRVGRLTQYMCVCICKIGQERGEKLSVC